MQSRTLIRRLRALPSFKSANSARPFTFTTHPAIRSRARPQLPFLTVPISRNLQSRFLTTQRKRWLAYEVFLGFKFTGYFWAIGTICVLCYWSIQQEWLERKYPSPHEWGFLTRLRFRLAKWSPDRGEKVQTDWCEIANFATDVLKRLEDKNIEGQGIEELTEGGIWIDGIGKSGYDITAKSEPWRRGYYEVLMMCAKAAEHLDGQLVDKETRYVFTADQVRGPTNPDPTPIPPGSPPAPHVDNCERAYEAPETFYMRIMTTKGFTAKQKMDAALEYATWLDHKGVPEASERMYEWALQLASEGSDPQSLPYDASSYVLKDGAPHPSANQLTTLSALAVHKARNGDVANALPILISVLRARRALPSPASKDKPSRFQAGKTAHSSPWEMGNILTTAKNLLSPPAYPPPPDDGSSPPVRDAKELCEEAALNLYIGEIIYASQGSGAAHREDGLAWTREAVDLAEEQLHKLGSSNTASAREAKKTCRECLDSGLGNWAKMAARLAREERERLAAGTPKKSTWLGLWGDGKADAADRWQAEEELVRERMRRAAEVMGEPEVPKLGFMGMFQA